MPDAQQENHHHAAVTPVRVVLVEDSPVEMAVIRKALESESGIEIVATATNGEEGLQLVRRLRPDVVCTDYHMPVMDGLELTKRVMAECPCPILILSISMQPEQAANIMRMIEAGAVDVMPKPLVNQGGIHGLDGQRLAEKIRILKGVHCIPLSAHRKNGLNPTGNGMPNGWPDAKERPQIICIGSSTGGPQALYRILPLLPKTFPVPLVCVQHISPGFLRGLVEWLGVECALKLKVAATGLRPEVGTVYFAPEGKNLRITPQGVFDVGDPAATDIYLPNIDALFSSASTYYHGRTVGVLLSGMGNDGVRGMGSILSQGGKTMVQDQASSVIFGMPGAAMDAGVAQDVLPVDLIAAALINLVAA